MGARPHRATSTSASGIINVTPPVNHPARVAERVAMMDHVSGGRFEFGTGRGSSTTEMGGFGITDPEITRAMYDEVIVEFKKMWADEQVQFDGQFFSMPERNVLPKPYVKPHPPMWVAAGNPETFEKAGRDGPRRDLLHRRHRPRRWRRSSRRTRSTSSNAEPVGEYVNDNIAVTTSFMCLEDRDRGARLHDALGQRPPADARVPLPRHVPEAAVRSRVAHGDPRPDARRRSRRASRAARRWSARPTSARPACRSGSTSASTS